MYTSTPKSEKSARVGEGVIFSVQRGRESRRSRREKFGAVSINSMIRIFLRATHKPFGIAFRLEELAGIMIALVGPGAAK
jgi:hypothetical protein